ncbi:MAG: hypothetical protein WC384_21560 [Prolixibacteraceae bacterium]
MIEPFGTIDVENINTGYFSINMDAVEIKIYAAIGNSKVFNMDIKLAVVIFFNDGKEIARKVILLD